MRSDFPDKLPAGENSLGDDFGCSARSSRAKIRHEIADGKIDLMSDRGDHGSFRMENGASDDLFIERPEVLKTAATACHQDQVDRSARFQRPFVEPLNRPGDFLRRSSALHPARRK